jgi:RimJ/RimL family protein N-acetyltransferase
MTVTLSGTSILTTERLILRAPVAADWEGYADFLTGPRSVYAGGPLDRPKAWIAFGHFIGHWVMRGYGSFIITLRASGEALGLVGPWFPDGRPEQELGWVIWSDIREGQGLAYEAAVAVRDHAFRDLGWPTAVSYIHPANARSIALAERLGAQRDPAAKVPKDDGTLVYRHPAPEVRP